MDNTLLFAIIAFTGLSLLWARNYIRKLNALPLPPGPKGLPILGNMFQLGDDLVHVTHRNWAREFSKSLYLHYGVREY